ncbi:MAG TPA: hypothetical protein VNB23_00335 [Ramlibacter sp.]|nr:hypothetical protein [Ramlibacter sp.]
MPDIDSDIPVALIPMASVAPLDGPADGERINTFALAPQDGARTFEDALSDVRERVLGKPLTHVAGAFLLGLLIARVLR